MLQFSKEVEEGMIRLVFLDVDGADVGVDQLEIGCLSFLLKAVREHLVRPHIEHLIAR